MSQPLDNPELPTDAHKISDFDEILEKVGNSGKYQKVVVYGFVGLVAACSPFLMFGNVFALDVPDHWCKGKEVEPEDPHQLELWKKEMLPLEVGASGLLEFSKCRIHDPSNSTMGSTMECPNGWSYDKTNYWSSIPTDYNWVCGKETYAADAFTCAIAGGALGTVVFGILADKIGRKSVMLMLGTINLVFRAISLYVPHMLHLFFATQFIAGLCFPPMYSIILILASEICGGEFRSRCYVVFWVFWVFGNCFLPFTYWLIGDWFLFGLGSLLPGLIVLILLPFMQESPRWLISVGKNNEAMGIIKVIADTNGVPIDESELKQMIEGLEMLEQRKNVGRRASKRAKTGVWSLFQNLTLIKHTICLTISITVNNALYYGVTLNVSNMAGNMYLNYFLLGFVELPSSLLAGVLVEKTGRRWTQTAFFLLCLISCFLCVLGVLVPDVSFLGIVGGLGIKFGVSVTSLIALLQATELFPTELRSTGTSVATTVMTVVSVACPYIVYTSNYNVIYPYLIFILASALGLIVSVLLPETLHQHLPETVEDACNFGKGARFWSYLPKEKGKIPVQSQPVSNEQRDALL